jgi:demethylmenaquinone methyltransferase/2-methoxy-6-polyprenyl-1,4-benzoquinol methylase
MIEPPSARTRHARLLFAGLGRRYDRMGALLSFGQDPRWRRFLVSRIPDDTRLVLDVATGTGLVARELRRSGRANTVVGLDQSEPMLRAGDGSAGSRVAGSAESLPFADETFDAVTVTYLFRYVDDPGATLAELARVVKPGGCVASLEFGVPTNPVWRAAWWLYTRLGMPAIGALASREWYEVGRFLGPSIERYWQAYPLAVQADQWHRAGLWPIRWRRMSLGGGVITWGIREA